MQDLLLFLLFLRLLKSLETDAAGGQTTLPVHKHAKDLYHVKNDSVTGAWFFVFTAFTYTGGISSEAGCVRKTLSKEDSAQQLSSL